MYPYIATKDLPKDNLQTTQCMHFINSTSIPYQRRSLVRVIRCHHILIRRRRWWCRWPGIHVACSRLLLWGYPTGVQCDRASSMQRLRQCSTNSCEGVGTGLTNPPTAPLRRRSRHRLRGTRGTRHRQPNSRHSRLFVYCETVDCRCRLNRQSHLRLLLEQGDALKQI